MGDELTLVNGGGHLTLLAENDRGYANLSQLTALSGCRQTVADFAKGDAIERRRWTNQTELAARLGTVPDVLSRVIRELTKAGLIEKDVLQNPAKVGARNGGKE